MHNTQPIEKQTNKPDEIEVVNVWQTIQGEGPFAGERATFIRLAGCNLQCPFCDTDYSSQRLIWSPVCLAYSVANIKDRASLVVITGGEPFRQNISRLIWELHEKGLRVQIETNGLFYREETPFDLLTIVCSPKTPMINDRLRVHIDAYKYILEEDGVCPIDGLPISSLGYDHRVARPSPNAEVYVQPLDEGCPERNARHTEVCVQSCLKFGYKLCLQVHKLIGVE